MKRICLALIVSLSVGIGCGTDDGNNTKTNNSSNNTTNNSTNNTTNNMKRTGQVACGKNFMEEEVKCSANQYCADSVLSRCEIGCLSDDNCTAEQVCVKEAMKDVGSCQTGATNPCDGVMCEQGSTCRSGKCVVLDTDPCRDVQCTDNKVCQNGQCVTQSTTSCQVTLTAQDGCAANEICIFVDANTTTCRAFSACDAQGQCAQGVDGAVCSSKAIQGKDPQCLTGFCLEDSECPSAFKCVKGDGEPLGECSRGLVNDFCVDGDDCVNDLVCDRDPNQEDVGTCQEGGCKTDADCGNTYCVIPTNADEGECSDGRVASTCYEEADCIEALTCDLFVPGEPGLCVESF